jgi:hypothetical protein
MVLKAVLRDLIGGRGEAHGGEPASSQSDGPVVLNVGGNTKEIPIPAHYGGWRHLLLDIDPKAAPDIVCDARELAKLAARSFDAVYCAHNLEHYYRHEAMSVLGGFRHVLKDDGFAEICVPDMKAVMERVVANGIDLEDVLYVSPGGPILVRDVIYGWSKQIEQSGNDFFAHKNGFTASSLGAILRSAGFAAVFVGERKEQFEICAFAFKAEPTAQQRALIGM